MKELFIIGFLILFALVSAKLPYSNNYLGASSQEGYYDYDGRYHPRSKLPWQMALDQQYSRSESLKVCQSTTHEHGGLESYIHYCEMQEDRTSGKM